MMSLHKNNIKNHFFDVINCSIRFIKDNNKFYFNILDLSIGLKYYGQKYLYNYYYIKCNDIKIYYNEFIDIDSVQIILNRSRKSESRNLLKEILEFTKLAHNVVLPNRLEIDIYNSIKDYLEDYNVESNKCIGRFYPDIIIRDKINNSVELIIEINEFGHSTDKKREECLKKKLGCDKFINENPHDKNYSTGKLLKKITKLL